MLETNEQTWQSLLNFLHLKTYSIEFIIGGELQPLPEKIEDIFPHTGDRTINLCIDEEHLDLHCHFFTSQEIEFNLWPCGFHTEEQVVRLLAFIQSLGKWLGKKVILTPENMETVPLFQFDPVTDKGAWIFES